MKRLTTFGVLFGLVIALAACGGGGGSTTENKGADTSAGAPAEKPAESGGAAVSPVDAATAGSVSGKVSLTGTPPENDAIDMSGEADCAKDYTDQPRQETILASGGALQNVLVYVKDGLGDMKFPTPKEAVTLDQQGCRYHPHVFGLMTGQTLTIVNSDSVLHNIHPKPVVNRPFNVSQPTKGMKADKTFSKAEVPIQIGCDVHDWMNAYMGVFDHPYYSVSGADGTYKLDNLPPGDYTIVAWQEKLGPQEQKVTVAAKEAKTADFKFEVK